MSTGLLLGQGGGGSIPAGLICMWSGSSSNIPNGWALCNGNNNTPDLRDKFVLGAGKNYSVGVTGGEKEVILTIAQIPSHNHDISNHSHKIENYTFQGSGGWSAQGIVLNRIAQAGGSSNRWYSVGDNVRAGSIIGKSDSSSTGEGNSHNNMPPYYALCFIMKL